MSEKKLTPMQEHIAWLEEQFLECIEAGYSESYINAYNSSLRHARKMLEKEREVIDEAFRDGNSASYAGDEFSYYDETFKTEE